MQRARRPSKALSSDRLRGAAARGDVQLATRELEKGAEVDEEDEQTGYTALMEASESDQLPLVELLVRGYAIGNAGVPDLALGAHESLRHRRLRNLHARRPP